MYPSLALTDDDLEVKRKAVAQAAGAVASYLSDKG
jgi:hypothetical protein